MKILAIRGKNLASLADEFELALDKTPLDRAGLFAIVGPTGAGKSTLLDAMCLALYGQTPRLSGGGGVLVEDVSSRDPRAILRRGAGEGWAEVDFIARDGQRWRARWTIHRARGRVDGNLQSARHQLWNLEKNDEFGSGKLRETQDEIQRLLGLSFDQFRRAVLLAQGDFASFLRANDKERGELLEQITGLTIYRALSKRAFERAKEAAAEVERVRGELQREEFLTNEQRRALDEARNQASESLRLLRGEMTALQRALDLQTELAALRKAEGQAEEFLQNAVRAWDNEAETRRLLEEAEALEPLRALALRRDEAVAAVAKAEQAESAALSAIDSARQTVTQRETADAAAVQAREAASLARQEAEPLLRQAGHQEKLIAQAEDALKKSEATAQERERLVKAAQAKRAALQRQSETAEKTRVQHQAWLKERADWEPLATQWTHWRQTLLDYREAAREARDASKLLREISVEFDAAAKTEADLAARFQTASQGREQALLERQKRLEEAEKISAGVDLDGEMDRLKAVGEVFNDLKVLAESLARASKERQERVAEAEACEKRAAALKAESEESRRAAEIAEARLKDAQAERERWIRVSSLDARRGELVQGEPCSLCGSKDHPWAQDAPPAAAEFLRQSEESVQKLSATLETSRRHATESAAGAQAAAQTAVRDRREARKREEAIAENLMGWEIAVQKLAEPERPGFKPSDADASDRIERELAGLRERWSELKTKRGERQDLLKKADKALDRADKLRGEADRFQESRDAQTRRKAEAQNQKTRVEDALARHKREMAQAARALEDAFPIGDNWRQRLEADPDAFAENCAQRVQEWSRRSEELQAAQSNLTALAPDLAAAEVETATRREALEEARQSVEMNQALRADLRRRRGELFGGRSVEEETRRLEEAVRAAEAARETASKLLQEAKSALAAAEERRAGASRRAEEARQTLLVRRDELAAALVRLNVAEERLQAFLALDPAVHAERRAKIDSLKSERHRAETVLEERRRARSERENAAAPGPAPETLAHQLADAETKRDSFEGELSRIRATLQRDDETRARAGALLPLLQEKERESERWAKLSELIGSADGMKFTRYAQGATLELLVDEANHHLRSLAPRYALARVPNAELELLIIDRDMGDERRPVNTLSGGETFLASLALALGLSSLSSGGRRTGSLFIDEGFGTLDRDTLDRAVALLESLPSGLGCQVGIISHVEGLSERVAARARVEPIAAGRARLIVEATGGGS